MAGSKSKKVIKTLIERFTLGEEEEITVISATLDQTAFLLAVFCKLIPATWTLMDRGSNYVTFSVPGSPVNISRLTTRVAQV